MLYHTTVLWYLYSRGKKYEPVNIDVCHVKIPRSEKCREQEKHLICRESPLDKAQCLCVCLCVCVEAPAQILAMRILSAMKKAMEKELFQHLFIAPVHLHTRQSAKPELNGISGRIYSWQNCGGLVELKTVSIRDCFLVFLTKEFLEQDLGMIFF